MCRRLLPLGCLLLLAVLVLVVPARAQEEGDFPLDLPDYPPPPKIQDPHTGRWLTGPQQYQGGGAPPQQDEAPASAPGLPADVPEQKPGFFKKLFGKKEKPIPEEVIVNVGPRAPRALPHPLLRLPVSVRLETPGEKLLPGFYLVQATASGDVRQLTLLQSGRPVLAVTATARGDDPPPGPVEPVKPAKPDDAPRPPRLTAEALVTEDGQAVVIIYREGDKSFRTDPLPTALDSRRVLP